MKQKPSIYKTRVRVCVGLGVGLFAAFSSGSLDPDAAALL